LADVRVVGKEVSGRGRNSSVSSVETVTGSPAALPVAADEEVGHDL